MIACEVMFVAQRADGSQGSSVWLVQLVLHRLCSNEQMSHSSLGVYKACRGHELYACIRQLKGSVAMHMQGIDQSCSLVGLLTVVPCRP